MAVKTDEQLKAASTVIKAETVKGANTATRIGQLFEDVSDSKANKTELPDISTKVDKVTGKSLLLDTEIARLAAAPNLVSDENYVHTDNNYEDEDATAVSKIKMPEVGTLTTGSNAIDLTNLVGKRYNTYDMASGALTLTVAANPIMGGCATGIIIADGSTVPTVSAFTVLSGEYDNTNDVENHYLITHELNGSNTLVSRLQWIQPL